MLGDIYFSLSFFFLEGFKGWDATCWQTHMQQFRYKNGFRAQKVESYRYASLYQFVIHFKIAFPYRHYVVSWSRIVCVCTYGFLSDK